MDKWGNFVFNEPYIGNEIKQINNVVLPKQYLEFMKKHNGGQGDIGETWLELFTLSSLTPCPSPVGRGDELLLLIFLFIFKFFLQTLLPKV